jgi:crotonobetainyl-CoA:carnitine CoA-transferase CaiB-like acyl-CoA transferase
MAVDRNLPPTHDAPYRGLRVLDFGQGIASPYCAMLLGVYGADVIKVEPPEGDWSRYLGTTYGSHTTLSAVYNRGKRSLCLDLKQEQGIAVARQLARESDVFIEGFRPGVAAPTPGIASLSEDSLRPAPDIGQDSYEILMEAGLDRRAIDDLIEAGAVRQAKLKGGQAS